MKKINRLLDEDELNEKHLRHLIENYDLIKFSKDKKFPGNMSLNAANLFNALMGKDRIKKNFIFEMEDFFTDIQDFVQKNQEELKLILFCAIAFKKHITPNEDPYMTYLGLSNFSSNSNKKTTLQKKYESYLKKPVNTLFKEAKI